MKRKISKILSILLIFSMFFSFSPVAFSEGVESPYTETDGADFTSGMHPVDGGNLTITDAVIGDILGNPAMGTTDGSIAIENSSIGDIKGSGKGYGSDYAIKAEGGSVTIENSTIGEISGYADAYSKETGGRGIYADGSVILVQTNDNNGAEIDIRRITGTNVGIKAGTGVTISGYDIGLILGGNIAGIYTDSGDIVIEKGSDIGSISGNDGINAGHIESDTNQIIEGSVVIKDSETAMIRGNYGDAISATKDVTIQDSRIMGSLSHSDVDGNRYYFTSSLHGSDNGILAGGTVEITNAEDSTGTYMGRILGCEENGISAQGGDITIENYEIRGIFGGDNGLVSAKDITITDAIISNVGNYDSEIYMKNGAGIVGGETGIKAENGTVTIENSTLGDSSREGATGVGGGKSGIIAETVTIMGESDVTVEGTSENGVGIIADVVRVYIDVKNFIVEGVSAAFQGKDNPDKVELVMVDSENNVISDDDVDSALEANQMKVEGVSETATYTTWREVKSNLLELTRFAFTARPEEPAPEPLPQPNPEEQPNPEWQPDSVEKPKTNITKELEKLGCVAYGKKGEEIHFTAFRCGDAVEIIMNAGATRFDISEDFYDWLLKNDINEISFKMGNKVVIISVEDIVLTENVMENKF